MNTPEIITLCGSTKFKEEFEQVNEKLTLEGKVVISVGVFGHAKNISLSEEQKKNLDLIHKRKIDLADSIMVINKDNYIGESTRSEIDYALRNNKKIYYYTEYFR